MNFHLSLTTFLLEARKVNSLIYRTVRLKRQKSNIMNIFERSFLTATAFLLFSVTIISNQQLHFTVYAGATCVNYEPVENTITITCDASFTDVANTIKDPVVLEKLRGDNGSEYLLKANLQVDDDATLSMGPPPSDD